MFSGTLNLFSTDHLRTCLGHPPKPEHFFFCRPGCLNSDARLIPFWISHSSLVFVCFIFSLLKLCDDSLKDLLMLLATVSIVVSWAPVLCVWADWGQHPLDYPLTLFRFPPVQSARPTSLRERAGLSQEH